LEFVICVLYLCEEICIFTTKTKMTTTIITMGDITGRSQTLPDRKIIKEAQRNMCMSASFWVKIKAGKIPYIFDKEKKELVESSYTETMTSLKEKKSDIYWLTDEEYPEVNKTAKNIDNISAMKQSYQEEIEKYK